MKKAAYLVSNFLLGIIVTGVVQEESTPAIGPQETATVAVAQDVPAPAKAQEVSTTGETGHAPNIVCEQVTFNFGKADNHREIEHTFLLKNTGDLPLVISNVRRTCGCTVAKITEKIVPPAGESEVTVKLLLKGRKGRQHKTLTVMSNDPDTPQLRLYLRGEAVAEVDISPNSLFFREVISSAAAEKAIDIRFNTDVPVNITALETKSEQFSASREVIDEGRAYRLIVRSEPLKSIGRAQDTLVIKTDNEAYPFLEVPLTIDVVGDLTYSPKKIILMQADQPVTRYIVVSSNNRGKEFEIENVEPPNESVKVQVAAIGRRGYRIQLDNLVPSEKLSGTFVKITTSVEGMREIVVPCFLIAPPRTNPGFDSPGQRSSGQAADKQRSITPTNDKG